MDGLSIFGHDPSDLFGFKTGTAKKKASPPPPLPKKDLFATNEIPVQFPANFYPPAGAESVDVRKLINVPANQLTELLVLSFKAQTAQAATFYKYGIYTDALDATLVEFIPRINGQRVLRYHGDPQNNFKLNLSVGPDLSDGNMIPCQLYVKPNDIITWHVKNLDAVVVPMGVRLTGYVDVSTKRKTMSFGG